jgi:protein RecA
VTDVKALVAVFEKKYKKPVVIADTDDPGRLPTGIFALDLATGGGFAVGRINVIFGPESSAKSTVCLKAVAQAQRLWPDKTAVYVDIEGRFSGQWAEMLGVDMERRVVVGADNAEQAVDIIESMLYASDVSVVVIDSLAAMTTKAETEKSAEDALVGTTGLMVNKLYRKVSRAMSQCKGEGRYPTLLLINQIRYKIGVMFGDPEIMPGGPAFRYASSLTLRLYGKDEYDKELSTALPAFKEISVVVKKWSVPILARNSKFVMATLANPNLNLKVGECYEIATVLHYLKSFDWLVKQDKSYVLSVPGKAATQWAKQDDLKKMLTDDPVWAADLKDAIVKHAVATGTLLSE